MDELVSMLFPLLAIVGGRYLYEGIQILFNFVNDQVAPQFHAIVLVVVQFTLLQFGQWIGIPMPESLDGFTAELATAITSALIAMGWHSISNKKSATRAF